MLREYAETGTKEVREDVVVVVVEWEGEGEGEENKNIITLHTVRP